MSKTAKKKPDLLGLFPEEIDELLASRGLEPYRSEQIVEWLYERGVRSFKEMTNLPKNLRSELEESLSITGIALLKAQVSRLDGTKKFLFGLDEDKAVESVLLPDGKRSTVCISTQVGCSFGCIFCASGGEGLVRNLRAGEIVDQVRTARSHIEAGRLTNIVLMGMGEPLANYEAVVRAIRIFEHKRCLAFGKRRITLSTAGYVPGIRRLAQDDVPVRVAISLHATDNKTRNRLMPINRKYPLEKLIDACKPLAGNPQTPLTIEYMLMRNINDSPKQARELVGICKALEAKVNLITYNPALSGVLCVSPRERILQFQEELKKNGILAFVRRSHGLDIDAACGQLRALWAHDSHRKGEGEQTQPN